MDISEKLTVANLTPPGYFNLAETAPDFHKSYVTWWNNILARRADQAAALRELVLTPWMVNHPDAPRTQWLNYLLTKYGMGYFGGTNNQAAALYKLVSNAWQRSTLQNMLLVAQTFCLPPFSWFEITSQPSIIVGYLLPAFMDTGFVIYSTAGSSPSTPAPTQYLPRAWGVPAGWTKTASSATYYARGYKSGDTIVWCAPRPVSDFSVPAILSAGIPLAVAAAGSIAIVNDDGSGDVGAVYYSDGAVWRKNSTPNADLGLVVAGSNVRPVPEPVTVWAPNPSSVVYAVDSSNPPPIDGASQGFGSFSTWSQTNVGSGEETIHFHQVSGGYLAVATLLDMFRRVKTIGESFTIKIDGVTYTISDLRKVS